MLGHTCAHEYTDTCSRGTLAHTRHVQRAAQVTHFTSHAVINIHTRALAPMQVKALYNKNGPSNPRVIVVPSPLSAGMRDDGKRSGLNVLISGEITHGVGAGRDVEGQTPSVQSQIGIQQREKVARREIDHNPFGFLFHASDPPVGRFLYLQAGVGWINPPSSESKLQCEHTSPTKTFSLSLGSI